MSGDTTDQLLRQIQMGMDDDLSVYSISAEESGHGLSEMNRMLEDDSVEVGRSESISEIESPFKTSSPLKHSPVRKVRRDYRDHLDWVRTGGSPIKFKGDTIEHTIDRFLADDGESVLEDFDKTELLIRETHKIINSMSIGSNDRYTKLLTSSINKLIKALENSKRQDQRLRQENASHVKQNAQLQNKVTQLNHEVAQLNRKLHQQAPQQDALLKRENALLREKLIKYKKLSDDARKENEALRKSRKDAQKPEPKDVAAGTDTKPSESRHIPSPHELAASLAQYLEQNEKKHTYRMLPGFEEMMEKLQRDQDARASEGLAAGEQRSNNEDILRKLMTIIDINNKLYAQLLQTSPIGKIADNTENKINDTTQAGADNARGYRDLVVVCTCGQGDATTGEGRTKLRCKSTGTSAGPSSGTSTGTGSRATTTCDHSREDSANHSRDANARDSSADPPDSVYVDAHSSVASRRCPKCSTIDNNNGNDTVNLMGEHKWSI